MHDGPNGASYDRRALCMKEEAGNLYKTQIFFINEARKFKN